MMDRSVLSPGAEPKRHPLSRVRGIKRLPSLLRLILVFPIAVLLAVPAPVYAYAVLSHEAIIDAAWETHIKPLLLKRFPQATEEDLSRAQAYAYGGAIILDIGYYPYGSPFFNVLTQYFRNGDFYQALLPEALDPNQYALAVWSLSHYAA